MGSRVEINISRRPRHRRDVLELRLLDGVGHSDPLFYFHRSKEDLDATSPALWGYAGAVETHPEIPYGVSLEAFLDVPIRGGPKTKTFYESGTPAKDESEPSIAAGKLATEPALEFIRGARADIARVLPGLALPYYEKIDEAVEGLLNHELFQPADDAGRALKKRHLDRLTHPHHRAAHARLKALAEAGDDDDAVDAEQD